jgi:hypothetical protein
LIPDQLQQDHARPSARFESAPLRFSVQGRTLFIRETDSKDIIAGLSGWFFGSAFHVGSVATKKQKNNEKR